MFRPRSTFLTQRALLTSQWTGDVFLLADELLSDGTWTLYNLQFLGIQDGFGMVSRTSEFQGWPIAPLGPSSFSTLAELCCGLRDIAQGSNPVQGCTLVSVDETPLACNAIHCNGGLAILGDVADHQVMRQIHGVPWPSYHRPRCISMPTLLHHGPRSWT